MTQYSASYVGGPIDLDHGEGFLVFRWPHERYGYDELRIDLDGHCSRRMPLSSGDGPPQFVGLDRNRLKLRFEPELARKLGLDEEIEIQLCLGDADFENLRRVVEYFGKLEPPATS